jgi:hypothetical protein
MQSGAPFALEEIWENWKVPHTDEWIRTFCIITTTGGRVGGQVLDPPALGA